MRSNLNLPFQSNRTWDRALDVRTQWIASELAPRVESQPNGVAHFVIAPRRYGKTWTLKALEAHFGRGALFLDLRRSPGAAQFASVRPTDVVLCDEAGGWIANNMCAELAQCLSEHASRGARFVFAVTPAEYAALCRSDARMQHFNPKDAKHLPPPTLDEQRALMSRDERATRLLESLPFPWQRSLMLLEMLGEHVCRATEPRDAHAIIDSVVREATTGGTAYMSYVFGDSFDLGQRSVLRAAAVGELGAAHDDTRESLERCGMLTKEGEVADPILRYKLCPLRIHHVSDVHAGPKSASQPGSDSAQRAVLEAAGVGRIRDAYLDQVASLPAHRAPHLAVISGDLVEWATPAQYAELAPWLDVLKTQLKRVDHPMLDSHDPRIVAVGGNHDASWSASTGTGSPQQRHQAFADAMGDIPHPHLEQDPTSRGCQHVTFERLGVSIVLLGSAEIGGEVATTSPAREATNALEALAASVVDASTADGSIADELTAIRTDLEADPVRRVQALIARLDEATRTRASGAIMQLFNATARIDPGLVHDQSVKALREHRFADRIAVRIAVLHHPVTPMSGPDLRPYDGLLNAVALKRALIHARVGLVLHGHAHTGWMGEEAWVDGPSDGEKPWVLRIAAAPSLGSREVADPHGYNEIEITPEIDDEGKLLRKTVRVRRFVHRAGAWQRVATMGPFVCGA